jgi:hypothetical protein
MGSFLAVQSDSRFYVAFQAIDRNFGLNDTCFSSKA